MTYLIAQMLFSLLVAVALGGTIGWWMAAPRRGSLAWGGSAAVPLAQPAAERRAAAPAAAAALIATPEKELIVSAERDLARLREEAERLRAELAAAQRRAAAAEQEGAAAVAGERAAHEQTRRELDELRAVHADCDFAVSALEAQIVALRAAGGAAGGARRVQAAPPRASAAAHGAAVPEALVVERTRTPDDLKQINGVGPRLERLLNDLGIFYFQQIAALRQQDIAWLDARLEECRGQIERDDWVAQAADLLAGVPHEKIY